MSKKISKRRLSKADDAPELTARWFANADLYKSGKPVRRGRLKSNGTS